PLSERLVRTTRRLARRLDAEWIAAYVEVPDARPLSADDADRVAATLQLAEALGARSVRLTGPNVAATLVDFARSRNVTKIVAGKPLRPRWRDWRRGSIIDQILARSQGLDVYVISGETTVAAPPLTRVIERRPMAWRGYLVGLLLVLLATLVGLPLRASVNPTNLVMLYLVVVMLTAIWLGRRAAFLVSLSSVLVFDFMFVPPYYELGVADAEYLLTFAGLLAMGLVISTLATRARREAVAARRREAQTAVLFELSQSLAAAAGLPEIAQAVVVQVGNAFNSPAALLLPAGDDGALRIQASSPDFYAAPAELEVADWVWQHGGPAGKHTDTHAEANGYYLPLQTSGETIGVLAVALPADYYPRLTAEQRRFLASFANQVALALENAQLAEQARRTRLLEETEKLQTTLLNSISHDLRTPLATITGALSSLLDDEALLSAAARRELALTAFDEALRLNRLVGNLLDMTRLESGAMKVVCQPYDVQELVGATLAQMRNRLQGYTVQRQIPFDLPPVNIDLTLMVQALLNLIDNVVKYAPPDEPIEIEATLAGSEVVLAVKDRGPGLPEADLPHIFNKFFRLDGSSSGGTGLGLSIARGIVEAHGGRIQAENRPDGGAVFSFTMPVAQVDLPVDA
ncbi:MAG: sensor histidine kinase KdpD, partial [Anaerolineales bacterium]|nr:sensor histidine kinase KdpD [Anaerolineales bacterium]